MTKLAKGDKVKIKGVDLNRSYGGDVLHTNENFTTVWWGAYHTEDHDTCDLELFDRKHEPSGEPYNGMASSLNQGNM